MIAKIIVGIVLFSIAMACMVLALYENTVNGKYKKHRYLFGVYIALSSFICGVLLTWFAFCV